LSDKAYLRRSGARSCQRSVGSAFGRVREPEQEVEQTVHPIRLIGRGAIARAIAASRRAVCRRANALIELFGVSLERDSAFRSAQKWQFSDYCLRGLHSIIASPRRTQRIGKTADR
jgi:hypothetical protein